MIHITDKTECCGCNACGDICPTQAISFHNDNEGFWYPEVDRNKCINCGLCDKSCPMLHTDTLHSHGQREPKVYGGYHKNISIRFDSTSGGAFSALANAMYKQGGYVSGAVFNPDWTVSNYISNNKKDLSRLRSSKYVESNAEGLYKEIKRLLKEGEKVLACGSPCQMAGLRTFLGKDYDNLIIVDFLCRATNSPKAYRRYLEYLEDVYGGKIVSIKAKNKDHGWRSLARKVVFDNGKVYYGEGHEDPYRRGYHLNYFERPCCYNCKFKGLPRIADISLADFWGIENIDKSIDGNLGTSMIMINTEKGEKFFDGIKSKMVLKEFDAQRAFRGNFSVVMGDCCHAPKGYDREQMFKDMDAMRFDALADKYFPYRPASGIRSIKSLIKKLLKFGYNTLRNPSQLLRNIKWSVSPHIDGKVIFRSHCAVDLRDGAKIMVNKGGVLNFGDKRNLKSKFESRLLLERNSRLIINGNRNIMYDCDIQIFEGANLTFGSGRCNSGLKIVCAESIIIGDNVNIGRDVWIRDNNGGHFIIQTGYTDRAAVIINDNVWIGSNVVIMKGVTIGEGAVVAANSVVTSNVPAGSMVSGNPAKVVSENVIWVK
ncbi:MAG: Coenzyme F420 hydrogenase/dehydrogenase, beta subunit C-terminal domain [Muribaculaceae bacterium]|nr:Coenzyme F420 hydrogenase/dehydrogenase, beta subunit C-terminal domain [Muribaculaceae bacterium]